MKTIAISIDEPTLESIDRLAKGSRGDSPRSGGSRRKPGLSRSQVVRLALHEFLARRDRTQREERERRVFAEHRELLARQAAALVAEQAKL
jgi:metal-responsive CopG/Arc/MetJ family transcriptional regulator